MRKKMLICCVLLNCSGGPDPGIINGRDASAEDSTPGTAEDSTPGTAGDSTPAAVDATVDALPPLQTQYKDARRILEFTATGVSCAMVCAANEGRCAVEGDTDPEPYSGSDFNDCFGRADSYIPRAHYKNEAQNYFPNDWLECADVPDSEDTDFFNVKYTLYLVECCCMLEEPYWLPNNVQSPTTCNQVCSERGLECRSYDRCRLIPSLCSESFPEFLVQSIAEYDKGEDGKGTVIYPNCDEVPGPHLLLSHTCMCF